VERRKDDRQRWADDLAELGELALETGKVKDAFANFRKLRSAAPHVTSPVLSSSGQLLCDKNAKLACWKEIQGILFRSAQQTHHGATKRAH